MSVNALCGAPDQIILTLQSALFAPVISELIFIASKLVLIVKTNNN
jgi:hypothetical protein